MTWAEILKIAGSVVGIFTAVIVPVGWAALRWKGSQVWAAASLEEEVATKEDLDGLGSRVNSLEDSYARTRELAEQNDDRLDLMEKDLAHQQERVMEHVIPVLRELREEMKHLSHGQASLETRVDSGFSSLGRSLDEMRGRLERQEDRT